MTTHKHQTPSHAARKARKAALRKRETWMQSRVNFQEWAKQNHRPAPWNFI